MAKTYLERTEVDGIKVFYTYTTEDDVIIEVTVQFWVGHSQYDTKLQDCHTVEEILLKIQTIVREEVKLHERYNVLSFYGDKPWWKRIRNAIFKTNN